MRGILRTLPPIIKPDRRTVRNKPQSFLNALNKIVCKNYIILNHDVPIGIRAMSLNGP
jgi:hypothetical protein